ncbi:MAG: hypothetical protein K2K70_02430 [Lachnospiraceae bacterium]|nr:hypothetical protein [Lachnospiraceae bacterium]
MRERLHKIRMSEKELSFQKKMAITAAILLGGCLLGIMQKWLDGGAYNAFPIWLQNLDPANYFGRLSFWILMSVVISIYAENPFRASVNTFSFLISMVAGYYVYCKFVAGFLPVSYMMFWVLAAFAAIPAAFVCWYARGEGVAAICISAVILGVLFSQAILVTQRVHVTHLLDLLTWGIGVVILHRKPKEYVVTFLLSLVVAVVYQLIFPYFG